MMLAHQTALGVAAYIAPAQSQRVVAGRPAWEFFGVELSDHVHQHEAQKIRVLNGGHQVLANVAELLVIETISDAMANPLIHAMFRKIQIEEIIPHISPLSGKPVADYLNLIDARFANAAIIDTVRRVAFNGSARHVGFILPSLRDGLATGLPIEGLALVEAAWARMCQGTRDDGSLIKPNDPTWDMLSKNRDCRPKNTVGLACDAAYYGDLATEPRFVTASETWLTAFYKNGVEATIGRYIDAK